MNILIAGGTGMIGTVLSQKLLSKGHHVSILSRRPKQNAAMPQFFWDVERGNIDPRALINAEVIVNLSGAGVADKRWTEAYKAEILDSRTKSAQLLLKSSEGNPTIHTYISASGVASYGIDTGDKWMKEEVPYATDFLAQVVKEWETQALKAEEQGLRAVCLRTGLVLSSKGGALPQLALPIKYFIGSPLGSGNQYISWIDIDDLVDLYVFSIENTQLRGIYNAVSPHPLTNGEFTSVISRHLKRPLWAPHVPAWALKLIVGEMANTLLGGNRVSAQKILLEGFEFLAPTLWDSLQKQLSE